LRFTKDADDPSAERLSSSA